MSPPRLHAELPADLRRAVALGGELGERFAAFDWDSHPLGPPRDWPRETRSLVAMALTSRFPTVLWLGRDLSLVYNDGYVPMLGKKHPAALGRAGRDVWPEIWDVIGPMLDGVLRTGTATWSDDLLLELASAGRPQERYFTFTYSPMFLADGRVSGIFCAVAETTERVLGERRLRALNALAVELVESHSPQEVAAATIRACEDHPEDLPFAAVYLSEETGGPASLRAATSNVRDEFDVHAADASFWDGAGVGEADVRGTVDVGQRLPELPSAPQGGSPQRAVVLGLAGPTAGSEAGVVVVGLNPLRPLDDQYEGFCRLLGDQVSAALASARAYENERRRAEALEELDRAKTTFLTNVSHEFRTPLTLMLGPLEDALADRQAAPDLLGQLRLAHRNGRRLLRLVNALLDFARLEAGQATVRPQVVDLGALTAQIASSFAGVCERAGIELVLDCEPVHTQVDVSMWETIVLNLISNAFKHTFRGSITVSVTRLDDGPLSARIADTGVGIEAGDLERLFERFYRPQRARGRSVEGSGIGLALVKNLVELHGGSIEIASEIGAGTAVSVALPAPVLSPAATAGAAVPELPGAEVFVDEAQLWLQAEPAGPPAVSAPAPRPLILIVDDNADMRDHLNRILGSRWATLLAHDGGTALQLIREQRPDLVVTDLMMPTLDGLGLAATIRGDPQLSRLPVIMLSARAGAEASGEGFAAGADDYVVKPFRSAELVNRVAARLQAAARSRSAERRRRSAGDGSAVAQLSGALTAARSVSEAVEAIVHAFMSAGLDPDAVEVGLRDEDPRLVRIRSVTEPGGARSERVELAAADSPNPICETIRTGRASVAGGSAETGGHTVVVQPLKPPGGTTFGALALRFPIPRPPARGERELVESIANIAGQALERVVAGEREHRIATALQDRLLDIQPCAGAAIAAAYRPAGQVARVGGDWYTATKLADGAVAVSVGDVVGHGLTGATTMSQLRGALGAAAMTEGDPGAVIDLLEQLADSIPGASCATLAYAVVEPSRWRVRYTCAGHPYPLVLGRDGRVRRLSAGRRPALASHRAAGEPSTGEADLAPGSLLLLYTDGLVERHGESLDAGLKRLESALAACALLPCGAVCDRLLKAMQPEDGYLDDVALLVLRPCGATATSLVESIPAERAQLPSLRVRLREWLRSAEMARAPQVIHDALLVAGEAISNAIEHGGEHDRERVVTLEVFDDGDSLTTCVSDPGRWSDARLSEDSGRGLTLIRGLSDDVQAESTPSGTRVTARHRSGRQAATTR